MMMTDDQKRNKKGKPWIQTKLNFNGGKANRKPLNATKIEKEKLPPPKKQVQETLKQLQLLNFQGIIHQGQRKGGEEVIRGWGTQIWNGDNHRRTDSVKVKPPDNHDLKRKDRNQLEEQQRPKDQEPIYTPSKDLVK